MVLSEIHKYQPCVCDKKNYSITGIMAKDGFVFTQSKFNEIMEPVFG